MTTEQQQKKQRRKRWIIFGSIVLTLAVIVGGIYGYRKHRQIRHVDGLKDVGQALLDEGNANDAYAKFRGYLTRNPEDIGALRGYATAIVEMNGDTPFDPSELINTYQRILAQEPNDHDIRLALIEQYHRINYPDEVIDQADILLKKKDSVRALEMKSIQLARTRRIDGEDGAISACNKLLEIEPYHLNTRLMLLQLMFQNSALPEVMMGSAREIYDKNPDHPVSKISYGFALQLTGEVDKAREQYIELAKSDLTDPDQVRVVSQMLDGVGSAEESVNLLTEVSSKQDLTELRADLCRRHWERANPEKVLEAFKGKPEQALDDPGAYPFVAMAAQALGKDEVAQKLQKLGIKSKDSYISTWAKVLSEVNSANESKKSQDKFLKLVREAVESYPRDPHLRGIYARQLRGSGYIEASVTAWERAGQDAPGWAAPMRSIAEIMLATQRDAMAFEPAKAALRRGSNRLNNVLIYLQAVNANLDKLNPTEIERVKKLMDEVEKSVENESLVVLRAELTAREPGSDSAENAKKLLQDVLNEDSKFSIDTWVALIRVSQRHRLGFSSELMDRATKQHKMTPELALTQATQTLSEDQTGEKAAEIFEKLMATAEDADSIQWQLGRTRLLRALRPNEAEALWTELLKKFPSNRLVKIQIVQDDLNWRTQERKLVNRVLKTIEAEDNDAQPAPIQIAQGRMMLIDAESDSELRDTAQFLNGVARDFPYLSEPYTLLGICYEKQGNRSRALDAYTSAHRIRPSSDALLNSRIRLHRDLGENDQAESLMTQYAESMAASPTADPAKIAQTFLMVGRSEDAIKWALKAIEKNPEDTQSSLLLARMYLATGNQDKADQVFEGLLEKPDLSVLVAAASYYLQTGRSEQSLTLMERLDDLDVEEATKAVVRGHFNLSSGDLDSARVEYEQAAQRGDDAHARTAFIRLITMRLAQNDLNGVMQIAKAATARIPEDERFKAIIDNEVLIRSVFGPHTAPFVSRLLISPEQRPVVEAALRISGRLQNETEPKQMKEQLASLRRLADQNPLLLELQNLLARHYLAANNSDEALVVAKRTLQAYPNNELALLTFADANMAAQRWDEAATAGDSLAKINPSYRAAADLVSARAALRRDLPNEALRLIRPHIELAVKKPESHAPIIQVQIAAVVAANRPPSALGELSPIVATGTPYLSYIMDRIIARKEVDYDNTKAWIDWVLRGKTLKPENLQLWSKCATVWHILHTQKDSETAGVQSEKMLSELESIEGGASQAKLLRSIFAEERGEYEQAERLYRIYMKDEPNKLVALNNLAMVLIKLDRNVEALSYAKRAVDLAPELPIVLDTLASAQLAANELANGLKTIERAIELDPKNATWHITRCRILIAKKDKAEALKSYEHIGTLITTSEQNNSKAGDQYLELRTELDKLLVNS